MKTLLTSKEHTEMNDLGFKKTINPQCQFEGTQGDAFKLFWIFYKLNLHKYIDIHYEDGHIYLLSLQMRNDNEEAK